MSSPRWLYRSTRRRLRHEFSKEIVGFEGLREGKDKEAKRCGSAGQLDKLIKLSAGSKPHLLLILITTLILSNIETPAGVHSPKHLPSEQESSFLVPNSVSLSDRSPLSSQAHLHFTNYSDNNDFYNTEHDLFSSQEPHQPFQHSFKVTTTKQEMQTIETYLPAEHIQPEVIDNDENNKKELLGKKLAIETCKLDRGCQRRDRLNETYLHHCSSKKCQEILQEFIHLDELINQFDNLFAKLLTRYNCHNGYSVKWSCEDCKRAYKDWLCSTNLPFYMNGEQIKPCISYCERVEQRCPYLHPIQKEQYGGQPVFICRDPNIPFVPEITPDIPYNEPTKCYDLCHLSHNLTELITDSLSKYDYDKCPDKGSIAEEVRSDPSYCDTDSNLPKKFNVSNPKSEITYTGQENFNINYTSSDGRVLKTYTITKDSTDLPIHAKKINDLKEVLAVYNSQPTTHSFGHHSSSH